jgi:streptogramin lyase
VNSSEVERIMRDDRGFLWLLTASKVQRFDGKNFRSWSFDERCVAIQQDGEGHIWMSSRQSVYRYKNDYSGFEKIVHRPYEQNGVRQIHCGPDKKLYLLHSNGLARWNSHENKFEPAGTPPFNTSGPATFLKSYGDWLFFRLSPTALGRYNIVSGKLDSVKINSVGFLYCINEDSVWVRQEIGSSVLVSFISTSTKPILPAQFEKKFDDNNFHITGCYPSLQDNELIVFMDRKGYFSYNKSSQQFREIKLFHNGLPLMGQPPLLSFYQEENGTVWFANEEGIVYYNPYHTKIGLLRSNTLPLTENRSNDVRNFAEDKDGNIWFATANGFCRWDKKNNDVAIWKPDFNSENSLNYSSVRSIGYSNGKIIIGQSEKGFWLFDPDANKYARPSFANDSIKRKFIGDFNSNMIRLHNGHYLILSRNLWLLDKDLLSVTRIDLPHITGIYKTAYEDDQNRLWLATADGIYVLNDQWKPLYSLNVPELKFWSNGIVQKNDSSFLVSSKYVFEIKLLTDDRITYQRIFPELKEIHISGLFKDSAGHIWLNGDNGLYRYIPGKELMEYFGPGDNVQHFSVALSNSFRSNDGTVYFGSMNGINYFVPEKIPLQSDSLQVYITNVTVNRDDSSWLLGHAIDRLDYRQNSIVFDFISPFIYNADKIVYRYRLDGADNAWIETGNNNSVRLTALQPGKYTFHAAASLNGKDWFETTTPLHFTIHPPFWQTWWFRSVFGLFIVSALYFYYRYRLNSLKRKQAEKIDRLQNEQAMAEKELLLSHLNHDLAVTKLTALRAQMNPHFIFNALNSIQQMVLRKQEGSAAKYLSKFSRLLRIILNQSDKTTVVLNEELETLNLYLELEALRYSDSFEYAVTADKMIDKEETEIPALLIQPFVENAIWHGLLHKEGKRRLYIHFGLNNKEELVCTIDDNGIGREAAARIFENEILDNPHTGKGIKTTEERLQLYNQQHHTSSRLEVIDKKDENGKPAGTKIILTLPELN